MNFAKVLGKYLLNRTPATTASVLFYYRNKKEWDNRLKTRRLKRSGTSF